MGVEASLKAELYKNTHKIALLLFYEGLEKCKGGFGRGKIYRVHVRRQTVLKMYWGLIVHCDGWL